MNEHWQRVKEIVADALELPEVERVRFSVAACGPDAALREEVDAMLRAAAEAGAFLERGVDLPSAVRPLVPGARIGPYLVEAQIGEGGFSEVYRVRQERPVERLLALKLLKPGMDSRAVLTRFAAERQTLARLDHPHIARLFDAGATEEGRPYFVMELVEGRPLPDHADHGRLDARQRIELMLQVCDAVEHAHRRGVIHRDLKPSNVLVERSDGVARAKVIDFGIAKLLGQAAGEPAARTATGAILGTPAYASPEQLGEEADVDTRSDVYALGVLLYELLTGKRPTDDAGAAPLAVEEIVRRACATEPRPPSQRRSAGGGAQRAPGVTRIDRELDWIVLRALERARERRYPSVEALALDLRRRLRGEAVVAGPPTAAYRFAKFARRHRLLLGSSALAATALLIGGIAAFVGLGRAREAGERLRELAEREAVARADAESALREAEVVGDFLADLLLSARPGAAGRDVQVADLLAASAPRLASIAEFPDAAARLHRVLGETWSALGEFGTAEGHLEKAVGILTAEHGPDDWRRIEALFELASLRYRQGRIDEGEPLVAEVEARARAARGLDHPLARRLWDLRAKAAFERGRYDQAAEALRGLLAVDEAGGRADAVIATLGNLAQVLLSSGARDEAARLAGRGHRLALERHGPGHPLSIAAARKFAAVQLYDGDHPGLLATLEPVVEQARRVLGADHPDTLGIENYLALGYQSTGRAAEAEQCYRRLLPLQQARLGPRHAQVLMTRHNLGTLLESRRELAEAEQHLRAAAEGFLETRGAAHRDTRLAHFYLARTIAAQGRHEEIAAAYAEAVQGMRELFGDAAERTRGARRGWAEHLVLLGGIQRAAGAVEAAAVSFRDAFDTASAVECEDARRAAAQGLAELAAAQGDPVAENRWRAAAR